MDKILAFAAAFPSSAWRSTAAAWHDTSSSVGPPRGASGALDVFPTSARANKPPSESSESSSSSSPRARWSR